MKLKKKRVKKDSIKREKKVRRWIFFLKKRRKKQGSTWGVNLETSRPSGLKLTCVEIASM
jgi:hypothetical protein